MRKRLTYRDGEGRPQWTLELLEDESGLAGSMIREALATYEDNDPQKDPKVADIIRESLSPRLDDVTMANDSCEYGKGEECQNAV